MTAEHSGIDDPDLGRLIRAESTFDDGTVAAHDWFAGSIRGGAAEIELMIDGTDDDAVRALLPHLRAVVADLDALRRRATDAIVSNFSDIEPDDNELDEGAADLQLEAIEATADGQIVLHFTDSCGDHFPDGYWPAAHLDTEGRVAAVTIES